MLVQNMASLTISTMALFTMGNMKKNKMLQISWNVQISHFQKIDKIAPTSDRGGTPPLPMGSSFIFLPSPSFPQRPSKSSNLRLFWDTPSFRVGLVYFSPIPSWGSHLGCPKVPQRVTWGKPEGDTRTAHPDGLAQGAPRGHPGGDPGWPGDDKGTGCPGGSDQGVFQNET